MKIKPKVKKYAGGGENSNYNIQQNIINRDAIKQTDAYRKYKTLKAVQEAEEYNRPKYEPSKDVQNFKAFNASAQLAAPLNPYLKAIGTGGDLATAINYGIDGQYKNAAIDAIQAGLQWIPFKTGTWGMLDKAPSFSTGEKLFNNILNYTQKSSDAKTITEAYETPKKQNGGSIGKWEIIEDLPKAGNGYKWSDDKSTTKPIMQPQNNLNISQTTGNRNLTPKELEVNRASMEVYNKNKVQEEYINRKNRIQESIDAQKQPLSLKNLQTQSQSIGDKFSLAMNSKYGNPEQYPIASQYVNALDYVNPAKFVGDMASGLGSVPQDINEGNYLKAGLSVATPLTVGAMAGIGTQNIGQFANNIVNPLAGTGEAFNNLYKEQIYKAFEPVGYGAKEKILNSPKTWVRNTFIKSPEERAKHIGSQLSYNENLFEEVGKNRLDAWRTGLGLNQKWDTFEKIGENSYRIKNMKPFPGEFSSIYNDLNANEINKMGYYSGENPLIGLTEKHEKVTSPKIQTEYGLTDINDIRKYLRKGDKVAPWEQYRIVEPSKNKDFSYSVYDTDKQGIMGSFRWDINKPSYPDYNIHYQSNDTWDLNPFENRGATRLKDNPELSKFHFKPLENLEALKLVGGKPFNIQNNFLVDPKTYEIKKSFKNGGSITRENEWELVNETNKKLPKRRLNLNKSSDWEIVD